MNMIVGAEIEKLEKDNEWQFVTLGDQVCGFLIIYEQFICLNYYKCEFACSIIPLFVPSKVLVLRRLVWKRKPQRARCWCVMLVSSKMDLLSILSK